MFNPLSASIESQLHATHRELIARHVAIEADLRADLAAARAALDDAHELLAALQDRLESVQVPAYQLFTVAEELARR